MQTFKDGLLQQGHCDAHERVAAHQPILTSLRRQKLPQADRASQLIKIAKSPPHHSGVRRDVAWGRHEVSACALTLPSLLKALDRL